MAGTGDRVHATDTRDTGCLELIGRHTVRDFNPRASKKFSRLVIPGAAILLSLVLLAIGCARGHAAATAGNIPSSPNPAPTSTPVVATPIELKGSVRSTDGLPIIHGEVIVSRPFYKQPIAVLKLGREGDFFVSANGPSWLHVWARAVDYQPSSAVTFWAEGDVELDATVRPLRIPGEEEQITARAQEQQPERSFGAPHEVVLKRTHDRIYQLALPPRIDSDVVRLSILGIGNSGFSASNARGYLAEERGFWTEFDVPKSGVLEVNLSHLSIGAANSDRTRTTATEVKGASVQPMRDAIREVQGVQAALVASRGSEEATNAILGDRLIRVNHVDDVATQRLSRIMLLAAAAQGLSTEDLVRELRSGGLTPISKEWAADERALQAIFYRDRRNDSALSDYLNEIIAAHADRGVVAMALLVELYLADRQGNRPRAHGLMERLEDKRFEGTTAAWQARLRFSADRPVANGKLAPPLRLTTLEGRPIQMADLLGKRVLIVFWASWCSFCRSQMDAIQDLQRSDGAPDIVFVSFDLTVDAVREHRSKWPMPGIHAVANSDEQHTLMSEWGFRGVPWVVLISSDGTIAASGFDIRVGDLSRQLQESSGTMPSSSQRSNKPIEQKETGEIK